MDQNEHQLAAGGLNDKEIKVYLACVQLGTDSAFNIAEKSGVKRATSYLVLRSLTNKGLVTRQLTKKALLYSATSPRNLLLQLENKKKEVEEGLPSLLALYNATPDKPSIQIFDGLDGVKLIYGEMIDFLKKGSEDILLYGDVSLFAQHPALFNSWLKELKSSNGNVREIINGDEVHKKYKESIEKNGNSKHEVRLLAEGIKPFTNDNVIMGNKLIIFSIQKTLFATTIENKEISSSYRTMFDLAWAQA